MTRMFRTSDMVLIALMVGAAGFTYKTKHDAEQRLNHIRKLEAQIRFEEDSIDLLKADWSLLTQPSRLQKLTEAYAAELALSPVLPTQIVGLDAIPAKPVEPPPEGAAIALDGAPRPAKAPAVDPITTGEVAQ